MSLNRCLVKPTFALLALVVGAPFAQGGLIIHPVENWAVHNQTTPATSVDSTGNSPKFTPADNALTVMGRFPDVELFEDGDYVRLTTTLTMANRTGNTGVNAMNTLLRIGLFDGPDAPVAIEDFPNHGIFIVYGNHNQTPNRVIRHNETATINPFATPAGNIIGSPGPNDVDNDSIQGAQPGPVVFELKLTRNAGLMDIYGKISGTDSVTTRPFITEYSHTGFNATNVGFNFDRAGFFFGGNIDAPNATLNNIIVETNVPEPGSCLSAVTVALAGAAIGRRRKGAA